MEEEEEEEGSPLEKVDTVSAAKALFWQAPGAMGPWALSWLLTYTDTTTNQRWRLILGLGALPSAIGVICSVYENKLLHGTWCTHTQTVEASAPAAAAGFVGHIKSYGLYAETGGGGDEEDHALISSDDTHASNHILLQLEPNLSPNLNPDANASASCARRVPVSASTKSSRSMRGTTGGGCGVHGGVRSRSRGAGAGAGAVRPSVWQSLHQGNNALRLAGMYNTTCILLVYMNMCMWYCLFLRRS